MTIALASLLVARGVTEDLGVQRSDNVSSIAASEAKGMRRVGVIRYTRVLGFARLTLTPVSEAALEQPWLAPGRYAV
jgi:hypothetical protein